MGNDIVLYAEPEFKKSLTKQGGRWAFAELRKPALFAGYHSPAAPKENSFGGKSK